MSIGDALGVPAMSQHYDYRSRSRLALDRISVDALAGYSFSQKLRGDYNGAAFKLRRSSDGAEQDIGFVGDLVNTAAAVSFCAGGSGTVAYLYDQGTHGRDILQATPSLQPRIVNAGVLETTSSGVPAGRWFIASDSHLKRADQLGLGAGSPALTIGVAFSRHSNESRLWCLGTGTGPNGSAGNMLFDAEVSRGLFLGVAGGNRQLSYTTTADLPHAMIFKAAAGAQLSAINVEENGTNLTQTAITNPTNTINLNTSVGGFTLGSSVDFPVGFSESFDGWIPCWIGFSALLTGDDLTVFRTELAKHV